MTRRLRRNLHWVLGVVMIAGCGPALPPSSAGRETTAPEHSASPSSPRPSAARRPAEAEVAPPVGCPFEEPREFWETCCLQGHKIGYTHTRIRRVNRDGRVLVRVDGYGRMEVLRSGQRATQETRLTSHETLDGRLVDFENVQKLGTGPVRTRGRVEGNRLAVEITTDGQTRTTSLAWSNRNGGCEAPLFSLLAAPMKPGERRTLRSFVPDMCQVATTTLSARRAELTTLPGGGSARLLRIECANRFPKGATLDMVLWTNPDGDVLKTQFGEIAVYRVSRTEALDQSGLGKVDLGLAALVPVERPIPNPHDTRRIRYRVSLAGGDPASTFAAGGSQEIKSLDKSSAELIVLAVRPDRPKQLTTPRVDAPTPDDLEPNSLIQSDDPRVRALAQEAIRGKTDAWSKAVALERHAHEAIRDVSFSYALASAADVAETREGDCTEHAVLLAAMARAAGLPARVAIGLVYIERPEEPRHAFGFHMWTEIHVGDRWIPMDATLGRGGIGAAHLQLTHSSMKDANAMSSFVPVVNVLGQLKIEVLEIE